MPDLLEDIYSDDIFLCYEGLATLLPILSKNNPQEFKTLLKDSNLLRNAIAHTTATDQATRLQCTTLILDAWVTETVLIQNLELSDGVYARDQIYQIIRSGL
jgi:hypothetical protein